MYVIVCNNLFMQVCGAFIFPFSLFVIIYRMNNHFRWQNTIDIYFHADYNILNKMEK